MGQKVHPHGIRLGIVKTWDAKWYADKDFATNLHEDIKIRKAIKTDKQLASAGVSRIEIERSEKRLKLTIHTAKPGMVRTSKTNSRSSPISASILTSWRFVNPIWTLCS